MIDLNNRYQKRKLFMRSKKILATSRADYATRVELAQIYGVAEITVRMWEKRSDDFPEALRTSVSGKRHPVYFNKVAVQAWLDTRGKGKSHKRRVVRAVK